MASLSKCHCVCSIITAVVNNPQLSSWGESAFTPARKKVETCVFQQGRVVIVILNLIPEGAGQRSAVCLGLLKDSFDESLH